MLSDIMAALVASSLNQCVPVWDYIDQMEDYGATLIYEDVAPANSPLPHDGVMYFWIEGEENVAVQPYKDGCVIHYIFPISVEAITSMENTIGYSGSG